MGDTIPFVGKIFQVGPPMKIKNSSTEVVYDVDEETTIRIGQNLDVYSKASWPNIPLKCKRNGNTVVSAGLETKGGPQPFTNGHGQTGATSSTSAANGSPGPSHANNGATGT